MTWLDWLAFVARQREPARLLVIGTYRPVEILGKEHPLRAVVQELHLHRQCEELRLTPLSEAALAKYLAQRFRIVPSPLAGEGQDGGVSRPQLGRRPPHPHPLPPGEREAALPAASLHGLARMIHQCTEGTPLFMVTVVDDLVRQGLLEQSGGGVGTEGGDRRSGGRGAREPAADD